MSDLASVTASAPVLKIGGVEVAPRAVPVRALGHLQAWINTQPKPHDLKALKEEYAVLASESADGLLARAAEENLYWPPRLLENPLAVGLLLATPEGHRELLLALLSGVYPGVDMKADMAGARAKVEDLLDTVTFADLQRLIKAGFDLQDEKDAGADPKAG